jgi:hypothetical protein
MNQHWRCNARSETFKSQNLLQATRRFMWSAIYLKEKARRMQRSNTLYRLCPLLPHLQYSCLFHQRGRPDFHKRNRNATVQTRYVAAWRRIIVRTIFICIATIFICRLNMGSHCHTNKSGYITWLKAQKYTSCQDQPFNCCYRTLIILWSRY